MIFVDNCEKYSYTKIIVPIILLKSPSDYDDNTYYMDIICDDFCQKDCYISTYKIEEIRITRTQKADCEYDHTAKWMLEMILKGGKNEDEIISILDELCTAFSLKYIRHYKNIQYCGFDGFSYERLFLERKYAYEDKVFSDNAMSIYCGTIEVKTLSSIDNKVFKLSKEPKTKNEYKDKLTSSFLRALRCKDEISRYILLYYLFEIMYGTPEYQMLKNGFKPTSDKIYNNTKRSLILFQYLKKEFNLNQYSSLGKTVMLDAQTLEKIIITRNDLTHRGDSSKVSNLMYHHLLPILQNVIIKL